MSIDGRDKPDWNPLDRARWVENALASVAIHTSEALEAMFNVLADYQDKEIPAPERYREFAEKLDLLDTNACDLLKVATENREVVERMAEEDSI